MNFNNFNTVHTTLLPTQTEWPYGGGYGNQEVGGQPYINSQQPTSSYTNFHPHHQNLYASYSNMFGSGGGGGSDSAGGCNSAFYATSTTPTGQLGSHETSYKIDFNNIVDEKILINDNGSNGESQIHTPTPKNS